MAAAPGQAPDLRLFHHELILANCQFLFPNKQISLVTNSERLLVVDTTPSAVYQSIDSKGGVLLSSSKQEEFSRSCAHWEVLEKTEELVRKRLDQQRREAAGATADVRKQLEWATEGEKDQEVVRAVEKYLVENALEKKKFETQREHRKKTAACLERLEKRLDFEEERMEKEGIHGDVTGGTVNHDELRKEALALIEQQERHTDDGAGDSLEVAEDRYQEAQGAELHIATLERSLADVEHRCKATQITLETTEEQHLVEKNEWETTRQELTEQLEDALTKREVLALQLDEERQQRAELEAELEEAKSKIQEAYATSSDQIDEEMQRRTYAEERLLELEAEYATESERFKEEFRWTNQRVDGLKDRLKKESAETAAAQKALEEKDEQLEELNSRLAAAEARIDAQKDTTRRALEFWRSRSTVRAPLGNPEVSRIVENIYDIHNSDDLTRVLWPFDLSNYPWGDELLTFIRGTQRPPTTPVEGRQPSFSRRESDTLKAMQAELKSWRERALNYEEQLKRRDSIATTISPDFEMVEYTPTSTPRGSLSAAVGTAEVVVLETPRAMGVVRRGSRRSRGSTGSGSGRRERTRDYERESQEGAPLSSGDLVDLN